MSQLLEFDTVVPMLRTRLAPLVPLSFIFVLAACANAPHSFDQAGLSESVIKDASVQSASSQQESVQRDSRSSQGGNTHKVLDWEQEVGSTPPMPVLADSIISRAEELLGTPYRSGGSTLKGFDCSGFVSYLFREEAGIQLPRSTRQMINLDVPVVSKADLEPGDILLFNHNGRGRVSHAGIYMGDGKFIHSSSRRSGGVRVDNLDDRYWKVSFLEGKRILH
ncbi:cell wall-associated NlpC family hydrolase [Pseudomonas duriflava]|uniref:Cell wall-associated NlpC family hydrolase n=1 Tax=Pseudomonas duriflava TaxID=459528 RepID=A0A562QAJ4_9PSED|nr:cell wall-associated NlpC family hydrolase [Pseudomonas duriflava]